MNANLFRTIAAALTVVVGLAATFFGCTTDAAGVTVCTASWLSPQLTAWLVMGLGAIHIIIKAISGGIPALFNRVVPVVPAVDAGPGVVTAAQVASNATK